MDGLLPAPFGNATTATLFAEFIKIRNDLKGNKDFDTIGGKYGVPLAGALPPLVHSASVVKLIRSTSFCATKSPSNSITVTSAGFTTSTRFRLTQPLIKSIFIGGTSTKS